MGCLIFVEEEQNFRIGLISRSTLQIRPSTHSALRVLYLHGDNEDEVFKRSVEERIAQG